jgi:outer membrane protein assembly factor BamE (lipoprotein component of BamABCDE complex)
MKLFTLTLLFFIVSACSFRVDKSGYMFENTDINAIKKGVTSKNTLLTTFGSPTITSFYEDKEVWIYYFENIKHILFFKPKVIERDVLVIKFDNENRVNSIKKIDLADEDREFFFNQNKTFVESHKSNFFKTIYENIGSIRPR